MPWILIFIHRREMQCEVRDHPPSQLLYIKMKVYSTKLIKSLIIAAIISPHLQVYILTECVRKRVGILCCITCTLVDCKLI